MTINPGDRGHVAEHNLIDARLDALEALPPGTSDPAVAALVADPDSDTATALNNTYGAVEATVSPRPVPPRKVTWVTTFAPGHGWVKGGAATSIADYTADAALGSQSLQYVAASAGVGNITKTALPPIDTTGRQLVVWIKTADLEAQKIAEISALVGDNTFANNFHLYSWVTSAAQKPTTSNRWTPLYLDFQWRMTTTGAPSRTNVTAIRLFITPVSAAVSAGNPLEILIGGVGFTKAPAPVFPNGVITFGFDDGFVSQYTEGKRILDQYGLPGTIYVIAERVITNDPVGLSLAQLIQMRDQSGWEIAGHAYSENVHTNRITGVPLAEAEADTAKLKQWMRANGFNSDNYAYPGGVFDLPTLTMMQRYFSSARTTCIQPPTNPLPPLDPMMLTQIDVAADLTGNKARIDECVGSRGWINVMSHEIRSSDASMVNLDALASYALSKGMAVATHSEVVDRTRYV